MEFAANEEVGLALFRESNDALIVFDIPSLTVVAANPACLRIARTGSARLVGRQVTEFLHSDSEELADQLTSSMQHTQFFHSREGYRWQLNGSAAIPVNVTISRIHTKPQPFGLLVLRDVSERERAMRELDCEIAFRKAVVDHAADGICVFHRISEPPYLKFTVWNERMSTLTGCRMEEINGRGWPLGTCSGHQPVGEGRTWVERTLDGDYLRGEVWSILGPDGGLRVLTVSTSTFCTDDGTAHFLAVVQDVTQRKQTEADLARRDAILAAAHFAGEQFLQRHAWKDAVPEVLSRIGRAADVSRVYVFENHVAPDGELLVSQRCEWVAEGIEPQDSNPTLQNLPWQEVGLMRWVSRLEQGLSIFGLVRNMPEADRRILEPQRILSLAVMPIHVAGRWYGFVGFDDCQRPRQWQQMELDALQVVADMFGAALERKQVEDALRASEARFRALVENVPDGIFVQTEDTFVYLNDNGAQLLGADDSRQLIGTRVLDRVHPDSRDQFREWIQRCAESPHPTPRTETHCVRLDGSILEAEFAVVPFIYEGKRSELVFFRDIADHKLQGESQLRSQKLEALGNLAGGIAHDFNNILYAIAGYTELAREDLPAEHVVHESLDQIAKGCSRATELVRRILTSSRPQDLPQEVIQLQSVLEEAIQLLRPSLPAMLELRTFVEPDLPPVLAHSGQIHQLLVNLATNAADAVGPRDGWIVFRLDATEIDEHSKPLVPSLPPGRYVRLAVSDNGCGMDRPTLARIFDPFFTAKPFARGSGLGLAMVHGIVQSHAGGIEVNSQPGKGTTFRVYFPAASCQPHPLKEEPRQVACQCTARLLYVDDEEPLVYLAKRMLQRLGYVVFGFTDPVRAVQEFRARPYDFDAVVTDLNMPGMNGFELVQKVHEIRAEIPVIMTTGYVRPGDQETAQQLGICGLILKPNTVDELVPTLHRLLGDSRNSDPSP